MRIIFTISVLFCLGSAYCQSKKINAETSIQNVTVFSSGARVERTGMVTIQPGRSEISFGGLSNQLDQQSVQLNAEADITLLSVQTTKDFFTERKIETREKELIDQISATKDRLEIDQKMFEVYKNEEAMLIKNQSIGGQSGVKTDDLKNAVEFHRQRLTDVYMKQLDIQKRIVVEQRDIEKNRAQLQEISRKKDSINYIVTALIDSKETMKVDFHLFYNIKDAGWYPTYDVRTSDITKPLSFLMNANVFQRSGETWKNVSLQLSSGNPKDNATPSRLQPWMLGFFDPMNSIRGRGIQGEISGRVTNDRGEPIPFATVSIRNSGMIVATDNNGYFKLDNVPMNAVLSISCVGFQSKEILASFGYATIALEQSSASLNEVVVMGYSTMQPKAGVAAGNFRDKKEESIHTVSIATQYQPTATVYKIDDKYNLESDGKTTTIGIKQFEVPGIYDYYAAPKIDPAAFLTAKIINWQDYDLQSGEVSLYFEGNYLGKTYVDLASTTDTLSLSLGKDNGIKISRTLIKEFSAKKFIGSNQTDSRQYEIGVRNTKRVPINITIMDQLPVSITKEITIDDEKAKDASINKETGIATWVIALKPVEEKKLDISYTVKYPKDRKLVLD